MKLSIIIPVYNAEKYVESCVRSLLEQDFKDYEIILVNDGSTDNSLQILQDLEKETAPDVVIRVIDQENGGVCRARNRGIDEAKGDWIMFVDNDDEVEKFSLGRIFEKVDSLHGAKYVLLGMKIVKLDGIETVFDYKTLSGLATPEVVLELLSSTFSGPWSKLYRRDFLNENHIRFRPEMVLYEDTMFNMDVLSAARELSLIDGIFYHYLWRSGSGARKFYAKEISDCIEKVRERRIDYFSKVNYIDKADLQIRRDAAFTYLFAIYSIYRSNGVKNKHRWLKTYWRAAAEGDPDWTAQLDSGLPRLFARTGRRSLFATHLLLTAIFGIEKLKNHLRK